MINAFSNKGFTLIEVFISIIILTVGLLGVLQAVSVAFEHNMKNKLRNEAVIVADNEMVNELSKGFSNVSTSEMNHYRERKVLLALKNYSVARTGSTAHNSKAVTYEVRWRYKGIRYSHMISSVISGTDP